MAKDNQITRASFSNSDGVSVFLFVHPAISLSPEKYVISVFGDTEVSREEYSSLKEARVKFLKLLEFYI